MNFYNENDPRAAAWLRELIVDRLIPAGVVDSRSIKEIKPNELRGYVQCHFFAGIGGWSAALRSAGWPDERPVWTGSCPCQPFSAAGSQMGNADPRHLWPTFRRLILQCSPPVVFGEQVGGKLGRAWLSGVRSNLEAMGYGVGAADLCAASAGSPTIRQRLFWVADGDGLGLRRQWPDEQQPEFQSRDDADRCGELDWVAGSEDRGSSIRDGSQGDALGQPGQGPGLGGLRSARGLGGPLRSGLETPESPDVRRAGWREAGRAAGESGHDFWADSTALHCTDGKTRRIKPTIFPLAHGLPGRVGLLRGSGNAIVPQAAASFIRAYLESSTCGELEFA